MAALVLNILSALAALCAGVLWFVSTRVSVPHVEPEPINGFISGSISVDYGDGRAIDPFATGDLQARWNRWAALAASAAAIFQSAAIFAGIQA
ncbi:hypothetical protein [Burkholderia sp. Tr-20390]|uniref:hypothetical protein n=1 Tax=Burkholderia sp. Tr-20390 TaxID=2703904 RepID=UPI001981905D|nr:hypothetical protein [Burkholderia sp. Tr-20390]MBN3729499.1 hypothetical protein [Burkholderia sp. Tr-20390]